MNGEAGFQIVHRKTAMVKYKLVQSTPGEMGLVMAAYFHGHILAPAELAEPAIGLLLEYNDNETH